MARISDNLRQQVIERSRERCEYCQTQQIIVVAMEIDHIIPESAGGETNLDNLCLACVGCNGFKLDFQIGIDRIPKKNPHYLIPVHIIGTSISGGVMMD